MTGTPTAALGAAVETLGAHYRDAHNLSGFDTTGSMCCLAAIIEAAAPVIAAAERANLLAVARRVGAQFPADHPGGAMAAFADYIETCQRNGVQP